MLDLLLKAIELIEQLFKFFDIREKNREEYFQLYVQPTYDTAEAIYRDYRSLLRELREMVDHAESPEPIRIFLEKRREEFLPARDRLRALVAHRVQEGRGTRFEAGVLGLMTGAVTSVDRPYFKTVSYEEEDGSIRERPGDHTVLDILQRLKARGDQDFSPNRRLLLRIVDTKMDAIEQAWQNVVRGYADLQASTLPATKVRENHRLNRHSGVARMRVLLGEIHGMIESGRFSRQPATNIEKVAASAVPEVLPLAQAVRETVHDLCNKEPNITAADLEGSLRALEQGLTIIAK
jgi:hypothetical protein